MKSRISRIKRKWRSTRKKKGTWKGVLNIPFPSDSIFLDIETELHSDRIWLIGVKCGDDVAQFFANSWNEEKSILLKFGKYLEKFPGRPLVYYSGSHFDLWKIYNRSKTLGLDVLHENLKNRMYIDFLVLLKRVYSKGLIDRSMGLKTMGDFLDYNFTHEGMDGYLLASEYMSLVSSKKKISKDFRKLALEYNLDDIELIPYIINKLRELFPKKVKFDKRFLNDKRISLNRISKKLHYLRIKDDINRISMGCDIIHRDVVLFAITKYGTTIPQIQIHKNTCRLVWKSKIGYETCLPIIERPAFSSITEYY